MITWILNKLLPKKVIVNCVREPYLYRWYLFRSERIGIFIHKFVRSDEDRGGLHDHPWSFFVIPIWRGYIEHGQKAKKCIVCNGSDTRELRQYYSSQSHTVPCSYCDGGIVCASEETVKRVWPIIGARFRPSTYRHRVELIDTKPAWSIFIRFKKVREWGFWTEGGFRLWNLWWQEKCE